MLTGNCNTGKHENRNRHLTGQIKHLVLEKTVAVMKEVKSSKHYLAIQSRQRILHEFFF